MANGANTLTAVDLLIEAAKVDRVIAMSTCGERVWLHAGDYGAHCSILSGTSRDKLRRERNDNNPANQSQRMTGRYLGIKVAMILPAAVLAFIMLFNIPAG